MIVPLFGHREAAIFRPNGTVTHYMPMRIDTSCKLNMMDFPHDTQTCYIQIGSWSYNIKELKLNLHGETISRRAFEGIQTSSSWRILSLTEDYKHVTYDVMSVPLNQRELVFTLSLKRRAASYIAYMVIPGFMLDAIVMVSFLLPIRSGERVSVCLTTFLAYSVHLLIIADAMPEATDYIPGLGEIT